MRKRMQGWELSIGVAVGVALGIVMDNVGLGMALGILGGGIFWGISSQQDENPADEEQGEEEKN